MNAIAVVCTLLPLTICLFGCGGGGGNKPTPVPPASATSAIVYMGSGGCDALHPDCKDDAAAEHVIQAVELTKNGTVKPRPDLAKDIEGMPVWMATREPQTKTQKRCFFVTRADTDDLVAFVADTKGALAGPVSTVKSGGRTPVFAKATADGNVLLVANYNAPDGTKVSDGAAASSFQIDEDCTLQLVDTKYHNGSSVNPDRQGGAHVHSFVPARGGLAYACDLGMDQIFTYKVASNGRLTELARTATKAGVGPRHLVQHPTKDILYVVTEMGESVLVYEQLADGKLNLVETQSLVPSGASLEGSASAEIEILPDGSALFATNRGKLGSVTMFTIQADGSLKQRRQIEQPFGTSGGVPRGTALAFGGTLLLAADQDTSVVVGYDIAKDGSMTSSTINFTSGVPPHPAAFGMLPISSTSTEVVV